MTLARKAVSTLRRHPLVATFVCMLVVAGVLISVSLQPASSQVPTSNKDQGLIDTLIARALRTTVVDEAPQLMPTRISIPAIDVDVPFSEPLGLTDTQEIEVPKGYEEVGYYKFGPVPGEIGPSVVLGHVDSRSGPAVFYSLGQLEVGEEVVIERSDGSVAVFEVERLQHTEQTEFPTADVYGDIEYAGLRLVTCSGTFDRGEQRYSHNLIVYAKLKEVQQAEE